MRRLVTWTVVVSGCALPLVFATRMWFSRGGYFGEICGMAVWIALAASIERWKRFPRVASGLRAGAVCWMVVQWLAMPMLPQLGFFALYAPAVLVTSSLGLIPHGQVSDFHATFVMTVMCGAQCAGLAMVLGRAVESVLALRAKVR